MTYRAIIFDKDGTLFDFQASWGRWADTLLTDLSGGDAVLKEVLAEALAYDTANFRFHPESVAVAGTVEEVVDALLPFLPNPPARSALIADFDASASRVVMAEVVPLAPFFAALASDGYGIGVVTNDAEAAARAHLEQFDLMDRVGFLAGYDSGHGAKPNPGPCLAAAQALGAAPKDAIMVGDSLADLVAGQAAGMTTIGVLTGTALEDDLGPFADTVLPDIGHLPRWLNGTA